MGSQLRPLTRGQKPGVRTRVRADKLSRLSPWTDREAKQGPICWAFCWITSFDLFGSQEWSARSALPRDEARN